MTRTASAGTVFGARLSRAWALVLLRGVLTALFGCAVLAWPGLSLVVFIMTFAAFAVVEGTISVFAAIFAGDRWWLALSGVASVIAGGLALGWPGVTAISILWIIGVWAVGRGVAEIVGAIYLRREIGSPWALGIAGFLSLLFGLAILVAPGAGALALVWLIGGWAIAFGVLTAILALRLRAIGR